MNSLKLLILTVLIALYTACSDTNSKKTILFNGVYKSEPEINNQDTMFEYLRFFPDTVRRVYSSSQPDKESIFSTLAYDSPRFEKLGTIYSISNDSIKFVFHERLGKSEFSGIIIDSTRLKLSVFIEQTGKTINQTYTFVPVK